MLPRLLAPALLALAAPAFAADVDVSAYPELAPDTLLPIIAAELRATLKDPYSVRDFVLCPARKVSLKNGKPASWSVMFSLRAKNSYGAYEGVQIYAAIFRNGRLSGGLSSPQFKSSEGLEGLINRSIARMLTACPGVTDERIQQLLSAGSSVIKPVE